MRRFQRLISLLAIVTMLFVTTGAARTVHEAFEHDSHAGHCHADDHATDQDHDDPPVNENDSGRKSPYQNHHYCLTCLTLAALGKMSHAPPLVCVLAPSTQSGSLLPSPSITPVTEAFWLSLAAPRGPPTV